MDSSFPNYFKAQLRHYLTKKHVTKTVQCTRLQPHISAWNITNVVANIMPKHPPKLKAHISISLVNSMLYKLAHTLVSH
jgi:hypothetical protein